MQDDPSEPAAGTDVDRNGRSFDVKFTDLVIRLTVIGLFAYFSLTLLAPFAIMIIWAVILAVALYPAFASLRKLLGGRGGLAATLITLLGVLIIVVPLGAVTVNVAETTLEVVSDFENQTVAVPRPPEKVRDWPVIGEKVYAAWTLASTNLEAAVKRFGPPLLQAAGTIVGKIAGVGFGMLGFAVSVLVAGFLFVPGPRTGRGQSRPSPAASPPNGGPIRRPGGSDDPQHLARGHRRRAAPGAPRRPHPDAVRCPCRRRHRLYRADLLHRPGRTGAGAAAGHHLGLVDEGHRPGAAPDGPADFIPVIDNVLKPILMARGLSTPMLVILLGVIGGTVHTA